MLIKPGGIIQPGAEPEDDNDNFLCYNRNDKDQLNDTQIRRFKWILHLLQAPRLSSARLFSHQLAVALNHLILHYDNSDRCNHCNQYHDYISLALMTNIRWWSQCRAFTCCSNKTFKEVSWSFQLVECLASGDNKNDKLVDINIDLKSFEISRPACNCFSQPRLCLKHLLPQSSWKSSLSSQKSKWKSWKSKWKSWKSAALSWSWSSPLRVSLWTHILDISTLHRWQLEANDHHIRKPGYIWKSCYFEKINLKYCEKWTHQGFCVPVMNRRFLKMKHQKWRKDKSNI